MPLNTLFSFRTGEQAENLKDARNREWKRESPITLDRDWLGRSFLKERGLEWKSLTQISSLWNPEALFLLAECWFAGPDQDSVDTLEIILRPENSEDYFYWEISPPDRCVDSHVLEPRVDLDYHWSSEARLDSDIDHERLIWRILLTFPFAPIVKAGQSSRPPREGDVWGLNFCRRSGTDSDREIAVWRPPYTTRPDFHQTRCLGNLFFLEE